MGLVAGVRIAGDTLSVRLQASGDGFVMPPTLAVTISHPTRAGLDQSVCWCALATSIPARYACRSQGIGWYCWRTSARPGA